jgi:hypothetical protein
MSQNTSSDKTAPAEHRGEYIVGSDIAPNAADTHTETPTPAESPRGLDDAATLNRGMIGDNAGRLGDSDAMTSGATGDPMPDDPACNP